MMAFLGWLESSGIAVWVREGDSLLAFPSVLTLHTFGLGILVGASAIVNLRLLGVARQLPLLSLRPLFPLMWGGFWLNAVTGSLLFAADATNRGTSVFFLSKMVFVALGVATMVWIKRTVFGARPDAAAERLGARTLAGVSMAAWVAAITVGRLLAYV